jgi:hypothetical protein
VLALEIGFHTEHPRLDDNDQVLARLLEQERRWRRVVGDEAHAGPFLGAADRWRRISETWPTPDLDEDGLAFEIGARLTDYITALEPLRGASKTTDVQTTRELHKFSAQRRGSPC